MRGLKLKMELSIHMIVVMRMNAVRHLQSLFLGPDLRLPHVLEQHANGQRQRVKILYDRMRPF